ncbi:protein FAM107B isoform X2 [Elephas maximus indicus]|uniref:protein FAM107B isoform X2 n=1 Tax=Elephas maximus indicus TaxID=99487 RepID=UPI002116BACC|nr:protein FAM107B isoform X2 [Elephas maximus indicus]
MCVCYGYWCDVIMSVKTQPPELRRAFINSWRADSVMCHDGYLCDCWAGEIPVSLPCHLVRELIDSPFEDTDLKDSYLIPRNIMAEPDYIEDDNPELIRPQKLINPVKTSRNHQDLHRELLMNQKRGLAPQNKPELQKVMEKRKRDQVIKQKEEEAQKKKSDLEIELLKRQQKLEQLELEQQKLQEEQENAPEFVKVKGNLRRTGQEVAQAQES